MVTQALFRVLHGAVAMMPGTAQAKLDSSGMNERPDSPTPRIKRSSRKCTARQIARVFQGQNEEEQDQ